VSRKVRSAAKPEVDSETKKEYRGVAGQLFVLCTPWPLWSVSGSCVIGGTPATGRARETDDAGREILSYVPLSLVADFLTKTGQSEVSRLKPFHIFPALIDDSNDPQTKSAMQTIRLSHVNRLRNNGAMIFGPGFEQQWFPSKFDRETIEKFQDLLGAHMTPRGKKYPLLPPIFYPNGSQSKRDVFLNPALVKVSHSSHRVFTTRRADKTQVLKVIMFGPSSLVEAKWTRSGPASTGTKWGIDKITPGAIALAAILVSTPSFSDPLRSC
jgi:hypothetical protein